MMKCRHPSWTLSPRFVADSGQWGLEKRTTEKGDRCDQAGALGGRFKTWFVAAGFKFVRDQIAREYLHARFDQTNDRQ